METWVQCCSCQKWRVVSDTLKVNPNVPWYCKYNLFDPKHQKCTDEQENMPTDEEAEEEEEPLEKKLLAGLLPTEPTETDMELVNDEEPFTPSKCSCSLCQEINEAVRRWNEMKDEVSPILKAFIKSVNETEHIAEHAEEDKQFVKGIIVDFKNP